MCTARVLQLSAGHAHTLALLGNGSVWSWGRGDCGQLGYGKPEAALQPGAAGSRPRQVEALPPTVNIAAGGNHSLVVGWDGSVLGFGLHGRGQLGLGGGEAGSGAGPHHTFEPMLVVGLSHVRAWLVTCGASHSAVVVQPIGPVLSACTQRVSSVYTFGRNDEGQLGLGTLHDTFHPSPPALAAPPVLLAAAGAAHTVLCDSSGEVWTCGSNRQGQLGVRVGSDAWQDRFVRVAVRSPLTLPVHVVQLSCGSSHTCAVSASGELFAWGAGRAGQVGVLPPRERTPEPKRIASLPPVATVDCGSLHTVVLTSDRRLFSWGSGTGGCLGQGPSVKRALVPTATGAVSFDLLSVAPVLTRGRTKVYQ